MNIPAVLQKVQCPAICMTFYDMLFPHIITHQERWALVCSPRYWGFFQHQELWGSFPWKMVLSAAAHFFTLIWYKSLLLKSASTDECTYLVSNVYFGHTKKMHRKQYFINVSANQQNLIISYWAMAIHISWKRYDNKKWNAKETGPFD